MILFLFFFNDTATTEIYTLSLHDALPIYRYGHYRCDALILASPMGSTAYSYAAGGPVVSPGAEGILVTPSAPLNGIARSLLLGPNEPLRLELTRGRPAFELDGVLTG